MNRGTPKGEAAVRLMKRLMNEGDLYPDRVVSMIRNGLCFEWEIGNLGDRKDWIVVSKGYGEHGRERVVHRSVVEHFGLGDLNSIFFGYLPYTNES